MVDASVVERYLRDGHATVRGVLDSDSLSAVRRHLAGHPVTSAGLAAVSTDSDPIAASIASDDRLVGLARAAIASDPEVFGFSYVVKPPRVGLPVLWHQDGYPWRDRLGIVDAVTIWVAIDPAMRESGGLRVVPGSHRLPLTPLRANDTVENVFGWEIDPTLVDEARAIDVELEPGDVSLHHPALLHSSGSNRTDRVRAALALRFCATSSGTGSPPASSER